MHRWRELIRFGKGGRGVGCTGSASMFAMCIMLGLYNAMSFYNFMLGFYSVGGGLQPLNPIGSAAYDMPVCPPLEQIKVTYIIYKHIKSKH